MGKKQDFGGISCAKSCKWMFGIVNPQMQVNQHATKNSHGKNIVKKRGNNYLRSPIGIVLHKNQTNDFVLTAGL